MEKISIYRSQIMGFAILWIMLFHSQIHIAMYDGNILYSFLELGYWGVDIFILLSGFGLYCSLTKSRDLKSFYKKRLIRVMPSYIIALILFRITEAVNYGCFQWLPFFQEVTTIGFWGSILKWSDPYWYVSSIVFLYLIAPFIYTQLNNKKAIIIIIVCSVIVCAFNAKFLHSYYNYLFARLPIFILGFYWGRDYQQKKSTMMPSRNVSALMCMGGVGLILLFVSLGLYSKLLFYNIVFYMTIMIVTFILTMIIRLCETMPMFSWVLDFLGGISLELYLAHGFLFRLNKLFEVQLTTPILILMFFMAIPIALMISKTSKYLSVCIR